CRERERAHALHELRQGAMTLPRLVARRQRRELDGNAVGARHVTPFRPRRGRLSLVATLALYPAEMRNRIFVRREIALGILGRQRGFAEHVERMQLAAFAMRASRPFERALDRLAHDELLPEHLHR